MTRYYKGQQYPIVSLQERVLMCLACKHVDDVVIGAPFILTEDLIKSLNIKKVVSIKNSKEDTALKRHQDIDKLKVARDQGILEEVEIEDEFYNVTTEEISQRVLLHKAAIELKVEKKQKTQNKYEAEMEFVQEKS